MCIRYRNINVFWLALVPSTIRTALMLGDMLGTTPLSFQRNSYVWRFYVWCRIADLVDIVRAYTGDNNLKCIYFEPKTELYRIESAARFSRSLDSTPKITFATMHHIFFDSLFCRGRLSMLAYRLFRMKKSALA